jgi:hypothetical protein
MMGMMGGESGGFPGMGGGAFPGAGGVSASSTTAGRRVGPFGSP